MMNSGAQFNAAGVNGNGPQDASADRHERPRRLNLLLSHSAWRTEPWPEQLPRLLDPIGVHAIRVDSGKEAEQVIRSMPVHIAVIDLSIPLDDAGTGARDEAGARMLKLIRRLEPTPPTVVIRNAQPVERERVRGLSDALREGAFAVVDRPVQVETLLRIMRRILKRYYEDFWPGT